MTVKTAISIPDDVFRAAEETAHRLGLSRSELYAKAVAEFVRSQDKSWISETLDRVLDEEGGPGIDPVLERTAFSSLPRDEW
jgi:predicted transcriptional regulator